MMYKETENLAFPTKLSMILYFLHGSKRYFFASVLFSTLASLFDLINPRIIGYTVDSLLLKEVGGHLVRISLTVVLIAFLGAVFRYFFRLFNAMGAEKFVETMRNQLFRHIEHLEFLWFMENQTGDIIQRCTSDVDTVKRFLSEQLSGMFRIVLMIILSLSFMYSIDSRLATLAAVFVPLIFLYSLLFHRRIGKTFAEADEEEGKLSSIVQENLTGVRVVRAFGRERYERDHFEKQNDIYTKAYMRLSILISLFWSMGDLISEFQVMLIVLLGAVLTVRGEITAGDYVAFVSYNALLVWPVRSLGRVISDMSKAGVSVDRIRYIMNSEEEKDSQNAVTPDILKPIRFDHVSFRYAEDAPDILKDVSFTINPGETFGILGGTGSGKSTLMYLLDRLYPLKQGSIFIGDTNIRDIKLDWLRKHIGIVLQEPYLFSRTLGDNIRIAREQATTQDVERAAKIASLDGTIRRFFHGYDTMVGERGVTLSGGQKQRAAIAQTVIRKAPVMIFDDSLSAVDAETDARIREELRANAGNSTVILISHRISTLMKADRILVLNRGRVEQIGTHEELSRKPGIYQKICRIQSVDVTEREVEESE